MNRDDVIDYYKILQIYLSRWRFLLALCFVFVVAAIIKFNYYPSFPASGKILIKDPHNSQLHSVVVQFARTFNDGASISDDKGSLSERAEIVLDTNDFFSFLQDKLSKQLLEKKYSNAQELKKLISFLPGKNGVLVVEAKTANREFTIFLLNQTLEAAKDVLTRREVRELNKAEKYLRFELLSIRERIEALEKKNGKPYA